jgi:hypothetical protein
VVNYAGGFGDLRGSRIVEATVSGAPAWGQAASKAGGDVTQQQLVPAKTLIREFEQS